MHSKTAKTRPDYVYVGMRPVDLQTATVSGAAAFEARWATHEDPHPGYEPEAVPLEPSWLTLCHAVEREHPGWDWTAVAAETSRRFVAAYDEWRRLL